VLYGEGGLEFLDGSHLGPLLPLKPIKGFGAYASIVDEQSSHWRMLQYNPGDAVIFCAKTVHRTKRNKSNRIRISMDLRCQLQCEPVADTWLAPVDVDGELSTWDRYSQGWSTDQWVAGRPSTPELVVARIPVKEENFERIYALDS
jgi:hypothetical protein